MGNADRNEKRLERENGGAAGGQRRHGSPLEGEGGREWRNEADLNRERRAARHLYLCEPHGRSGEGRQS